MTTKTILILIYILGMIVIYFVDKYLQYLAKTEYNCTQPEEDWDDFIMSICIISASWFILLPLVVHSITSSKKFKKWQKNTKLKPPQWF